MKALAAVLMLSFLAQACSKPTDREDFSQAGKSALSSAAATQVPPARQLPTIDPRSTEAAIDQVDAFAALLNQAKFGEAYMLLGPSAGPRSNFDAHFSRFSSLRVSRGAAGEQEGAAGSTFISVPLTVSGFVGGSHRSRSATAVLRRVNDVPGSTEAQRHWHIERLDWGKNP